MRVRDWLIPQEHKFFDMLDAIAEVMVRASEHMVFLFEDYENLEMHVARMKELENEADTKVHTIHEALNRTFVTPIDREDIVALGSDMDNVIDMLEACARRMQLYKLRHPSPGELDLAKVVREQAKLVQEGIRLIRDMKNADRVEKLAVDVNSLENIGDDKMNESVGELFNGDDPIHIIKHKEVLERLEQATDYCEDLADHLSDIVAKYR